MKAIYAGSFDMFTKGHMSVLEQAIDLFDLIYVVIAENPGKTRRFEIGLMEEKITEALQARGYDKKVKVISTKKLIVRLAHELDCRFLIRGLRNATDYAYEENMAQCNTALDSSIQTIYLRGDYNFISSSMVYELYMHGEDISGYLPYEL